MKSIQSSRDSSHFLFTQEIMFPAPRWNGDTQMPCRRCHISQKLPVIKYCKYLPPLSKHAYDPRWIQACGLIKLHVKYINYLLNSF